MKVDGVRREVGETVTLPGAIDNVYTCTDFPVHFPFEAGVAAVIVAASVDDAYEQLAAMIGCSVIDIGEIKQLDTASTGVLVLCDGDY